MERNRTEPAQEWNPSALHGATQLSPTPHKTTIPSSESAQEWNPSGLHGATKLSPTPHKSTIPSSESAQERNLSALHGATHLSPTQHKSTIPSSTLRSGLVTDDKGIILKQDRDKVKWNMDAKDMNIRKYLTMRKFAIRRAAKKHKAVVPLYITGMHSSASPLKKAFVLQTLRPTFVTGKKYFSYKTV